MPLERDRFRANVLKVVRSSSTNLTQNPSYFRSFVRGSRSLSIPTTVSREYFDALQFIITKAMRASEPVSNKTIEGMLEDLLLDLVYLPKSSLSSQIDPRINSLMISVTHLQVQDFDFLIPLEGVSLSQSQFQFGNSELLDLSRLPAPSASVSHILIPPLNQAASLSSSNNTSVFAKVKVKACDDERARDLAVDKADLLLDAFRLYLPGVTCGVRGDYRPNVWLSVANANITTGSQGQTTWASNINVVIRQLTVTPALVAALGRTSFNRLIQIIDASPVSLSKLERGIHSATYWIGSASKDALDADRLLKIIIALESLLLEGGRDKKFRMARRFASILYPSTFPQRRKEIFELLVRLYTSRSDIVHGGKRFVDSEEVRVLGIDARIVVSNILAQSHGYQDISALINAEFPEDQSLMTGYSPSVWRRLLALLKIIPRGFQPGGFLPD